MRARDLFIIGSIILCVGIVFGFIAVIIYTDSEDYKKNAVKTTAEVEEIDDENITIEYEVDGILHKVKIVSYDDSLYKGEQIDIYYKKNDPDKVMDDSKELLVIVNAIVGGILFLVGLFIDMFAVDKRRKNKKCEA